MPSRPAPLQLYLIRLTVGLPAWLRPLLPFAVGTGQYAVSAPKSSTSEGLPGQAVCGEQGAGPVAHLPGLLVSY